MIQKNFSLNWGHSDPEAEDKPICHCPFLHHNHNLFFTTLLVHKTGSQTVLFFKFCFVKAHSHRLKDKLSEP